MAEKRHKQRARTNGLVKLALLDELTPEQRDDPTRPGPEGLRLLRDVLKAAQVDVVAYVLDKPRDEQEKTAEAFDKARLACGTYLRALEDEVRKLRATTAGLVTTIVAAGLPLPIPEEDRSSGDTTPTED